MCCPCFFVVAGWQVVRGCLPYGSCHIGWAHPANYYAVQRQQLPVLLVRVLVPRVRCGIPSERRQLCSGEAPGLSLSRQWSAVRRVSLLTKANTGTSCNMPTSCTVQCSSTSSSDPHCKSYGSVCSCATCSAGYRLTSYNTCSAVSSPSLHQSMQMLACTLILVGCTSGAVECALPHCCRCLALIFSFSF